MHALVRMALTVVNIVVVCRMPVAVVAVLMSFSCRRQIIYEDEIKNKQFGLMSVLLRRQCQNRRQNT